MKFLQLNPEACERMWKRVRLDTVMKKGGSWSYQQTPDILKKLKSIPVTTFDEENPAPRA